MRGAHPPSYSPLAHASVGLALTRQIITPQIWPPPLYKKLDTPLVGDMVRYLIEISYRSETLQIALCISFFRLHVNSFYNQLTLKTL